MNQSVRPLFLFFVVFATGIQLAFSQSPNWADKNLPIKGGLVLWLDANTIQAARKFEGQSPLANGASLDRWNDASGNARHFLQAMASDQPQVIQVGEDWSVRFDGDSDNMRCTSIAGELRQATFFIVATPHQNVGGFRGLFSTNAPSQRDYESGITIDLGSDSTAAFDHINVEGAGFGGARNLLDKPDRFGVLRTIETTLDLEKRMVTLTVDGKRMGERSFEPKALSIEQLTLAARFYSNDLNEHVVRGPLKCDVVEVIIYDRLLSSEDADLVREYLKTKHATLSEKLTKELQLLPGALLVKADNPPPIQMLVPGFTVREIPVDLTNINNVRFRDDGRLMTLGYNGDLHLLSDTDGDGLEDKAELFWKNEGSLRGPLGLLLTPPGYSKGQGAFVPSKGKVSLIVDKDGDDKADEEIVVAEGWQEISQNVDAVGITMDKEGALYFGLGTANFANAYLVDEAGKSAYDIKSERGTVQRISPDFSKRETVCTGIRFPIAFAFNDTGDLFCSEQEGATWLPNGNPFDELLHIQAGRHYGFPPRHPRYNPNVIDEPSTFDYGPQHQSTCGMVFNKSVNGGPVFGPSTWGQQALVCGESRGKIWRTRLFKTAAGYVASTQLLAALQMLTIDGCVAPDGDFVVACHSGPPDWGTGPTGQGKLFRIRYADPSAPQPIATWPESQNEIRVAFDRTLDPLKFRNLAQQVHVEYGEFVRAGDRFETLVPPYALVQRQLTTPRHELPVAGVSLTSDLRTMIINTAMMSSNLHYAVTLPREDESTTATSASLYNETELDFSPNGVQATWTPKDGSRGVSLNSSGWLPHLNLEAARDFTSGSAQHDAMWEAMKDPGELVLRTNIDLHNLLRPVVQPGAKIDYEWPAESVTLVLESPQPISLTASSGMIESQSIDGINVVRLNCSGDATELIDLQIKLVQFALNPVKLDVSVHTSEDSRARPLPLKRFFMPWIKKKEATAISGGESVRTAEIEGGNWGLGRRVFYSEAAGCFKCHVIGGSGAKIGPDLSNLIHRDYASVMRDIVNPSFAINPDYIGHIIAMNDGQVLTGVLRDEAGQLILGDDKGNSTQIVRLEIDQMKPLQVSLMPAGLNEKLTKEQVRDLMTYLLVPPPHMPSDAPNGVPIEAPPIRSQAELATVLAGSIPLEKYLRTLNIVLVAGQKDHGPGEHDYPAWQTQWGQLLAAAPNLVVSAAWDFPNEEQMAGADVLIFFQKGAWNDDRARQLDAYQARGGGAVYIHWAVNGDDRVADFSTRIGLASKGNSIRYRHGPLTLDMHNTDHPIMRNIDRLTLYDESYWMLTGDLKNVTLLGTSTEEGEATPQIWAYEKNAGRVFVSIPGHYSWTFDDPIFRTLLLRGIAWTAKEQVDRFNEIVPLGARLRK